MRRRILILHLTEKDHARAQTMAKVQKRPIEQMAEYWLLAGLGHDESIENSYAEQYGLTPPYKPWT